MLSIGTQSYNLTDFNQELKRCPICKENGLFINKYVHFFQLNSLPIYANRPFSTATCRKCHEQFKVGSHSEIDQLLNESTNEIQTPRYLFAGAFLFPLAILSVIAFFASFK